MKILVTGGAGFIGSNFIRYILKKYQNYSVINVDKLTYAGCLANLMDVKRDKRYEFVKGDICDGRLLEGLMADVDCIVNFAAETHVDRSILGTSSFVTTNIVGTHVLLEIARKFKIKRFLQISTDEVYGSIERGSFTEDSPLHPNSPYSASKAGGDLLTLSYFKTFKLPVIITRSSNNFGPYQHPEKFIPLFIINAIQDMTLPLYGDGRHTREWLYVEDNCRGIDILLHNGVPGEIYNIGSGFERTNMEVAELILESVGKPAELIQNVKDRPAHDRRYSLDCTKIKKMGYCPSYSFEEAFRKTVKWYRNNAAWWGKVMSGEFSRYYQTQYQKRLKTI